MTKYYGKEIKTHRGYPSAKTPTQLLDEIEALPLVLVDEITEEDKDLLTPNDLFVGLDEFLAIEHMTN